jgi:hypothetical protein
LIMLWGSGKEILFLKIDLKCKTFFPVMKNIIPVCLLQFSFNVYRPNSAYLCGKFVSDPPKAIRLGKPFSCIKGEGQALNTSIELQETFRWSEICKQACDDEHLYGGYRASSQSGHACFLLPTSLVHPTLTDLASTLKDPSTTPLPSSASSWPP